MDNKSSFPLLGLETPGSRLQTMAQLTLALRCDACLGVETIADGARCRQGCGHCGAAFANWDAVLILSTSLDAVVQHALREAGAAAGEATEGQP